jgi:dihydrofolate reductase
MRASGGETAGATATSCCTPARPRQHHDTVRYGATLVSWLLRERLLDELHLLVFPVALGRGKRLLAEPGDKVTLKLAASAALVGALNLTYSRARPPAVPGSAR